MVSMSMVLYLCCFFIFIVFVKGFEGAFNANHELLAAAKNGNADRIQQVIKEGAYLEARNNNGVRYIR